MKELLVVKTGTTYGQVNGNAPTSGLITPATSIDKLDDGTLAVVEVNGAFVNGVAPTPTDSRLYFCIGRTTYGTKKSNIIERGGIVEWKKNAYVAPVAKIMTIGAGDATETGFTLNPPSTVTVGMNFGVSVIDIDKVATWTYLEAVKNYNYQAKAGDIATGTSALTNVYLKLMAVINADPNRLVNVTSKTLGANIAGLVFTAINYVNFGLGIATGELNGANVVEAVNSAKTQAIVDGVYYDANTTVTLATKSGVGAGVLVVAVPFNQGTGTSAQVLELESDCTTEDGNTDRQTAHTTWEIPSSVVSGTQYTVYTIVYKIPNVNTKHTAEPVLQVLNIAVVTIGGTNATTITALDNILPIL